MNLGSNRAGKDQCPAQRNFPMESMWRRRQSAASPRLSKVHRFLPGEGRILCSGRVPLTAPPAPVRMHPAPGILECGFKPSGKRRLLLLPKVFQINLFSYPSTARG